MAQCREGDTWLRAGRNGQIFRPLEAAERKAMLILVSAMLIAGGPVPKTIGEIFYGHAGSHNDPIADMTPPPPKLQACRSDQEIQGALAEKAQGEPQSCLPPLNARPLKTDADQPAA
jgi:hypothetical protein